MTAFIASRGLSYIVKISQGHAGAPSLFVRMIQCVIAGLDSTRLYLDGVIVFEATLALRMNRIKVFLSRLERYSLKLSLAKSHVGARTVDSLVYIISPSPYCWM